MELGFPRTVGAVTGNGGGVSAVRGPEHRRDDPPCITTIQDGRTVDNTTLKEALELTEKAIKEYEIAEEQSRIL